MMRHYAWIPHAFSLELRKILSYRVDFWAVFVGQVLAEFCVAYFLWSSIFSSRGVTTLANYSFPSLMLYYLLIPLVGQVIKGYEMHFMSREIYDGSLTRYLIFPLPFFGYKYIAHLAFSSVGILQCAAALVTFVILGGWPDQLSLNADSLLMGSLALLGGNYLYFAFVACLEMVSFWADQVWSLVVMVQLLTRTLGGALIPLAFFPDWSLGFLDCLPFRFFAYFPIQAILGQLTWQAWVSGMLWLILWSVIFSLGAGLIWHRGIRQYGGVGI